MVIILATNFVTLVPVTLAHCFPLLLKHVPVVLPQFNLYEHARLVLIQFQLVKELVTRSYSVPNSVTLIIPQSFITTVKPNVTRGHAQPVICLSKSFAAVKCLIKPFFVLIYQTL